METQLIYPKDPVCLIPKNIEPIKFFNALNVFIKSNLVICFESTNLDHYKNHLHKISIEGLNPIQSTTWPKSYFHHFELNQSIISTIIHKLERVDPIEFIDHITIYNQNKQVILDAADYPYDEAYLSTILNINEINKFSSSLGKELKLVNEIYGK